MYVKLMKDIKYIFLYDKGFFIGLNSLPYIATTFVLSEAQFL